MADLAAPALPGEEDYQRYDRIWQRVSPELNPYPEARGPRPPVPGKGEPRPPVPGRGEPPFCRPGGATPEELQEYLRDELADAQIYRHLAPLAPTMEGKRVMRALAEDEAGHAKALQAAYYLLTGRTYPVTVVLPPQTKLPWRDRLRERWHEESRGGKRYDLAADRAGDRCLGQLFTRLAQDEYRHAEQLRKLLERTF